ncbi:MAG: YjhX family toxin [Pseudomonadota bacterium]
MPDIVISNISKFEQRVLHALARGAAIHIEKDNKGKIAAVICVTCEDWILSGCTLVTFQNLQRRCLIGSKMGSHDPITKAVLAAVRGQTGNR